jgi:hypothetical protein
MACLGDEDGLKRSKTVDSLPMSEMVKYDYHRHDD